MKLNNIEIKNGLKINGVNISGIEELKIVSKADDLTEFKLKFVGKLKGLDDISENYEFKK